MAKRIEISFTYDIILDFLKTNHELVDGLFEADDMDQLMEGLNSAVQGSEIHDTWLKRNRGLTEDEIKYFGEKSRTTSNGMLASGTGGLLSVLFQRIALAQYFAWIAGASFTNLLRWEGKKVVTRMKRNRKAKKQLKSEYKEQYGENWKKEWKANKWVRGADIKYIAQEMATNEALLKAFLNEAKPEIEAEIKKELERISAYKLKKKTNAELKDLKRKVKL